MTLNIRLRLLLSHLAVIVLAMGLSGVLLLSFLQRYFLESTEESLAAQARLTAQALAPGTQVFGPAAEEQAALNTFISQQQLSNLDLRVENRREPLAPAVPGEVDFSYLAESSLQLGAQLETRIRILDVNGTVLVDSLSQSAGMVLADDPLVTQALAGRYAADANATTMSVALPMLAEGQLIGVVYLSQPLRDVLVVMRDLRLRWALATVIALGFSGLLGLLLSGAITRPLRRLTSAAEAVAGGDFTVEVPATSRDELGRLSRTFNAMTRGLQAARQMQVDFVANVSHELRTPLTAVKGTVETLRDGAIDDVEARSRFLATIENETDRMIRLVNDLLLLSRADSEALNLRREAVSLPTLAQEIATHLENHARPVTLRVESAPHLPTVWADRDRIAQVLLNLLDNAIKFSPPESEVLVRLQPGKANAVLTQVIDHGAGIPPEALPRLGQRFYRVDKARARTQGGSGLGLAIARTLIEAHGGQLWVESVEGHGTTVSFVLPTA